MNFIFQSLENLDINAVEKVSNMVHENHIGFVAKKALVVGKHQNQGLLSGDQDIRFIEHI